MPLQSGVRIGAYEIVALVGAGGMGEVYRARDLRLGRDVALKTIAQRVAGDADAVTRFERESRALASLNHPNIAAIYDVVEHAGRPVLVLEFVEGETLGDRVARKAIEVDQAIDFARQLTDALDTAHEAGIVHRDLKPANIKITESNQLKVLDFGLATAIAAAGRSPDADPANTPTITVPGISEGIILGTAAYMSPEQARGKRVDKRADIWAFGCVLFELLTGRRAFNGETTSDVIAAVIERDPDFDSLPPTVPASLRRVLARCLEKDVKRRARDIADVRAEIDAPAVVPAPPTARHSRTPMLVAIATLSIATGFAAWSPWRAVDAGELVDFTFGPPPGTSFVMGRPSVSPDGRHIAFNAVDERRVSATWIRSIATAEPRRFDGTESVEGAVEWSPDSRTIAFMANNAWRRISLDGGPVVAIVPDVVGNLGLSWRADDHLLLAPANRTSLSHLSITDGRLQAATHVDPATENSHRWPRWLPDNRHFLFTVRSDRPENRGIKIGTLESGEVTTLVNVASQGVYVKPGILLFSTPDEALVAQRIDPSSWTLQGAGQPIAAPISYNGSSFNGMFDASADGRVLAYVPATHVPSGLFWFDRSGKSLGPVGPDRYYGGARLSPDGKAIAVELTDDRYGTRDIWLLDPKSQALSRLTTNAATDWRAVLSPDGSAVAFASDRSGASTIFRVATGGGGESVLYRNPNGGAFASDWSRDGKHLVATLDDRQGRALGLALIPAGGGSPTALIDGDMGRIGTPRLSNDGEQVAFTSEVTGAREIYVMSIRDRRRLRVSTDGGFNAVWGRGRELFFLNLRNELLRAVLTDDGTAVSRHPEPMFVPCASVKRTWVALPAFANYDVTSDGERFLMKCDPPAAAPAAIRVILNWQRKLR